MKHILIITYYWPPYSGSGVQRWLKFSKYLPEFGYTPHIYTPENPHYQVRDESLLDDIHPEVRVVKRPIWEPYSVADFIMGKKTANKGLIDGKNKGFKTRVLNKIRANFFIPDPRKFWVGPSVQYLKKYIADNDIGQIISTGPPHSMHLIALGLKKALPGLKWIADIRDPWSRFDFLKDYGSSDRAIEKQEAMEKEVLDHADRIIATSFQMKDLLVSFDHSKFSCITNGFDAGDFNGFRDERKEDRICIYHAGLLNQLRNPRGLWKALDAICESNKKIADKLTIRLAGTVDQRVVDEVRSFPTLEGKITVEAYKNHAEVIRDYGSADILLLLVNNSDNAAANIPGKLFEYLATGKNILLVSEPGTDAARILQNNPRSLRLDYKDCSEEKCAQLESFILDSKKATQALSAAVMPYERKNLTRELVKILEESDEG